MVVNFDRAISDDKTNLELYTANSLLSEITVIQFLIGPTFIFQILFSTIALVIEFE